MQWLFDGLGSFLAWLYGLIPNYGVAIVLLTIVIRLLLLPLGIKQIRSMYAMQALQPKVKAVQQKYKGNRVKQQEEIQKLYMEAGVNPLGGCLPMLLQLPVLFALFSVISLNAQALSHIPDDSRLQRDIVAQHGVHLAGANLLCSATQAGSEHAIAAKDDGGVVYDFGGALDKTKVPGDVRVIREPAVDCGKGIPVRIPFYLLAGLARCIWRCW